MPMFETKDHRGVELERIYYDRVTLKIFKIELWSETCQYWLAIDLNTFAKEYPSQFLVFEEKAHENAELEFHHAEIRRLENRKQGAR
jgi:hypothetical protein